ncbi:MAG: 4-hydroxy-tetrahydrodipicolinate synthase [Chloroflexi bacterium]|nr:4-hydroxy-tetrahydrodipicolinate synthase [Chloroflexota bacterium]
MNISPSGTMPTMITPLTDNEQLDEVALRRLVNHLIVGGAHGLFAIGSQSEGNALTTQEKQRVMEIVVEEAGGRVPVYAGTGTMTTSEAIALTTQAEKIGVNAVSVTTPYVTTQSADVLYEHYVAIAKSTRLPILLHNDPPHTGVHISAELVARLSRIENIVGIKDSSGNLTLMKEFIRQASSGFVILMGQDALIFEGLVLGTAGAVAATGNVVPHLVAVIYNGYRSGDFVPARTMQNRLRPLRNAIEGEPPAVVVKEALALMGICSARTKSSIGPMTENKRADLKKVLQLLGVL